MDHWPQIVKRRSFKVPLIDIWRELSVSPDGDVMTYKMFTEHVREVTNVLANAGLSAIENKPVNHPRGAEVATEEPNPDPPIVSRKERFRLAREAREREAEAASSAPPPKPGKPDTSMIDGGEIWMSILGRVRVRELAALNLKLRSGEAAEADARPILEAARREAFSKRLGIRADQLTEEDMVRWW